MSLSGMWWSYIKKKEHQVDEATSRNRELLGLNMAFHVKQNCSNIKRFSDRKNWRVCTEENQEMRDPVYQKLESFLEYFLSARKADGPKIDPRVATALRGVCVSLQAAVYWREMNELEYNLLKSMTREEFSRDAGFEFERLSPHYTLELQGGPMGVLLHNVGKKLGPYINQ